MSRRPVGLACCDRAEDRARYVLALSIAGETPSSEIMSDSSSFGDLIQRGHGIAVLGKLQECRFDNLLRPLGLAAAARISANIQQLAQEFPHTAY